jgi:O-antigen/teichoic acid export membrane protein
MPDRVATAEAQASQGLAGRLALAGRGLREHTARGTVINAVFLIGFNALGLLKGFVVAALLTVADYGVWGIIVIGLGTLGWLKQVGISDKYVQQTEADQELAFQRAFTLELIATAAYGLVVAAIIPVLAILYGESKVIAPAAFTLLMLPAAVLQATIWIHYRRMAFVRQRALEAIDPITTFVVTVALAIAGAGYWSLVIGAVAGSWASAAAAVWHSPYPLRLRYDRGTLRSYVGFSWPLLLAGGSGIIAAQGSLLAGDHVLGLAGVGAIALASSIVLYTDRVDQIVTSTLYPAICAVRDRRDLLLESFVKSNRLALMWGFPFGVGVALFAADLVHSVIGDRWAPAIVLIQAFGLIAAANHIGFNWTAFFRASGETRPIAVVSGIATAAFLAFALPGLLLWELDGYAAGMGAVILVTLAARFAYLARLFPGLQIARHFARAIAPTVPAAAAVLALRLVEGSGRTPALALAEVAVYLVVTVAATIPLERDLLREVARYLRAGRRVPAGAAT